MHSPTGDNIINKDKKLNFLPAFLSACCKVVKSSGSPKGSAGCITPCCKPDYYKDDSFTVKYCGY